MTAQQAKAARRKMRQDRRYKRKGTSESLSARERRLARAREKAKKMGRSFGYQKKNQKKK